MQELRRLVRMILLEGAKERYMRMFDVLDLDMDLANASYTTNQGRHSNQRLFVESQIEWARRILKKDDAIVWYLRWIRLVIVRDIKKEIHRRAAIASWNNEDSNSDPLESEEMQSIKRLHDKLVSKMGLVDGDDYLTYVLETFQNGLIRNQLDHFFSLPIPQIREYQFGNKLPHEVLQDLREIERPWKEKFDGLIPISENDQVILEFDDGSAWVYLPRWKCNIESKAMGHCGNAGGQTTDRILSFRSRVKGPDGKEAWKPHLTFILDVWNRLGEMKGRGNDKPSSKYHPYIIALLKAKSLKAKDRDYVRYKYGTSSFFREFYIEGIKGGGYKPENNFSLDDLGEETKQSIIQNNPTLGTLKDRLKIEGMTDDLLEIIKDYYLDEDYYESSEKVLEYNSDRRTFTILRNEKLYYLLFQLTSNLASADHHDGNHIHILYAVDQLYNHSPNYENKMVEFILHNWKEFKTESYELFEKLPKNLKDDLILTWKDKYKTKLKYDNKTIVDDLIQSKEYSVPFFMSAIKGYIQDIKKKLPTLVEKWLKEAGISHQNGENASLEIPEDLMLDAIQYRIESGFGWRIFEPLIEAWFKDIEPYIFIEKDNIKLDINASISAFRHMLSTRNLNVRT